MAGYKRLTGKYPELSLGNIKVEGNGFLTRCCCCVCLFYIDLIIFYIIHLVLHNNNNNNSNNNNDNNNNNNNTVVTNKTKSSPKTIHRLKRKKTYLLIFEVKSVRFLWEPYRGIFWYWEVVECYRRIILTAGTLQ